MSAPDPVAGAGDERKIHVLKNAVVKLTKQKADLEERVQILTHELDAARKVDRAASPSPALDASQGSNGGWRRLFKAAQPATPDARPAPAIDPSALGELLKENERLHMDAFQARQAFEGLVNDLKAKLRDAEARAAAAEQLAKETADELRGMQAGVSAEHEALLAECNSLRQRLLRLASQVRREDRTLLSLIGPSAALDALPNIPSTAGTLGTSLADAAHRMAVCLDALLLLAARGAARTLEQLHSTRRCGGSDWDSSPATLRDACGSVHAAFHAAVSRARSCWARDDAASPLECVQLARAALLVLHDHALWIWRAVLLAAGPGKLIDLADDTATRSGARVVPLHVDATVSELSRAWRAICVTLSRWLAAIAHDVAAADRGEARHRLGSHRLLRFGGFVNSGDSELMFVAAQLREAVEGAACSAELRIAAEELVASASLFAFGHSSAVGPDDAALEEAVQEPSFLVAARQMQEVAAPTRHLKSLPPMRVYTTNPAIPSTSPPAEVREVAAEPDAAASAAAQQQSNRWLRIADDHAAFWRRQFELALVEADEKSALADARAEDVAALHVRLEKEKRERIFATDALQRQIQVLSDQLVSLTEDTSHR
jgi:hypothetical protein